MSADFDRGRVDLAREADFSLGPIHVRPSTRQVETGGASETLEPRIMQVLVVLARRRGEVVSRDDLIETCWEGRIVGDDALNRCISKIRKLGETNNAFRLETIPRVGYRMHEKGSAASIPSFGAEGTGTVRPARKLPLRLGRPVLLSTMAVLVIVIATAIWLGVRESRSVTVRPQGAVAILPFDVDPADTEATKLAQALTSYMANELTRAGVLVVRPGLSKQFAGDRKADAAKGLGARFLVDGLVTREGDLAHVFVRIDHAERGMSLWSTTVDGTIADSALLMERVTAVVGRMVTWTPTTRLMNYDRDDAAELTARFLSGLTFDGTVSYLDSAEAGRKLVERDPDVGLFQGSYAIQLMDLLPRQPLAERENTLKIARVAAQKAIELDPRDGGSWLALMRTTSGSHWQERIDALLKGISVDPGNGSPPRFLCTIYSNSGQTRRAHVACEKSRPLDPFNPGGAILLARMKHILGDGEGAAELIEQSQRRWPLYLFARVYEVDIAAWDGEFDVAAALLDQADTARFYSAKRMEVMRGAIEALRTRAPNKVESVKAICAIGEDTERSVLVSCLSALTVLGDIEGALAAADILFPSIDGATDEEDDRLWLASPSIPYGPSAGLDDLFEPWTASLRADPRIIPIFRRLGLIDYWRTTGNWPDFCETEPQSVCAQMKADAPT